jgi:hypothetical protein
MLNRNEEVSFLLEEYEESLHGHMENVENYKAKLEDFKAKSFELSAYVERVNKLLTSISDEGLSLFSGHGDELIPEGIATSIDFLSECPKNPGFKLNLEAKMNSLVKIWNRYADKSITINTWNYEAHNVNKVDLLNKLSNQYNETLIEVSRFAEQRITVSQELGKNMKNIMTLNPDSQLHYFESLLDRSYIKIGDGEKVKFYDMLGNGVRRDLVDVLNSSHSNVW